MAIPTLACQDKTRLSSETGLGGRVELPLPSGVNRAVTGYAQPSFGPILSPELMKPHVRHR